MPIMISSAGPWLYGLSTAVAQSNKWQNFVAKSKSFVINWLCRWMDELKKWHWKKGKAAQQCCWRRCMPLIRPHRRCNIKLNIPIIIAHRLLHTKETDREAINHITVFSHRGVWLESNDDGSWKHFEMNFNCRYEPSHNSMVMPSRIICKWQAHMSTRMVSEWNNSYWLTFKAFY